MLLGHISMSYKLLLHATLFKEAYIVTAMSIIVTNMFTIYDCNILDRNTTNTIGHVF